VKTPSRRSVAEGLATNGRFVGVVQPASSRLNGRRG